MVRKKWPGVLVAIFTTLAAKTESTQDRPNPFNVRTADYLSRLTMPTECSGKLLAIHALLIAALSGAMTGQTSPGATSSVNVTLPPSISQSGFTGSVPSGEATTEIIAISFLDAIDRGLKQNLGVLLSEDNSIAARGEKWKELSNLLPNVIARGTETVQQTSIAALGFRIPGVPRVIGPFNYFDMRAFLNQSVFNWNYIQKERAAAQSLKAAEYSYKDARELVVLVTGNAYLEAIAGAARVETAEAQLKTAQTIYDRAVHQQNAGVSPAIDVLRSQVELQLRQQQLIVARADFAKQKLALSRIIGLPLGQQYMLSDKAPYDQLSPPPLDEALRRAYASRPDYQAALAQARAA
jgi:outer membrane protein TolC